jgi:hypothetical protein
MRGTPYPQASLDYIDPYKPTPYTENFSLTLQHQWREVFLEAGYIVNLGRHIPAPGQNMNMIRPEMLSRTDLAERLRLLRNLAFTTPRFRHEVAGFEELGGAGQTRRTGAQDGNSLSRRLRGEAGAGTSRSCWPAPRDIAGYPQSAGSRRRGRSTNGSRPGPGELAYFRSQSSR